MYQGTTPTLIFTVANYDLSGATVYVTFSRNKNILTKSGSPVTVVYDDVNNLSIIICRLTQEETLAMKQGAVNVQIRFIYSNQQAFATNKASIEVQSVLDKQVISFGGATT